LFVSQYEFELQKGPIAGFDGSLAVRAKIVCGVFQLGSGALQEKHGSVDIRELLWLVCRFGCLALSNAQAADQQRSRSYGSKGDNG